MNLGWYHGLVVSLEDFFCLIIENKGKYEMKKVFSGLLALAMAASITGCNSGGTSNEPKDLADVKIGVIQLMQHDALDASYEGFKKELLEPGLKKKILNI